MDFDAFIDKAWSDHATDPGGVAARLDDIGPALVSEEAHVAPLAQLAHHVHGEHLGQWDAGIAFQQRLAALPQCPAEGPGRQAVRRCRASLALCAGHGDERAELDQSDAIRVTAMAAANLAERETPRAMQLLRDALAMADSARLPPADASNRALAVAGNNLACTLEEKAAHSQASAAPSQASLPPTGGGLSAAERDLMILAAQTGRHYWAIAGGWLETERAEYRLAMTWLHAGDPAQARVHAQQCLQIVQQEAGPALERFFAWEALATVERAAGDSPAFGHALAQARLAFADLEEGDRSWCQASLDKLGT